MKPRTVIPQGHRKNQLRNFFSGTGEIFLAICKVFLGFAILFLHFNVILISPLYDVDAIYLFISCVRT